MDKIQVTLNLSRSTKNKHLYVAQSPADDALGSVYIEKSKLPTNPPTTIVVTIKAAE